MRSRATSAEVGRRRQRSAPFRNIQTFSRWYKMVELQEWLQFWEKVLGSIDLFVLLFYFTTLSAWLIYIMFMSCTAFSHLSAFLWRVSLDTWTTKTDLKVWSMFNCNDLIWDAVYSWKINFKQHVWIGAVCFSYQIITFVPISTSRSFVTL